MKYWSFLYHPIQKISLFDYRIDERVKKALSKRNIATKNCNFLKESLHEEYYDLISMWEVIEHIPIELLKSFFTNIKKALKPNGIYVLSTPDFSNVYTRALGFWAAYPGEHLSVLSRQSLEPILNSCGLYITKETHECVSLDLPDTWYSYGAIANSTDSSRAQAQIINDFLKIPEASKLFNKYRKEKNIGSEIIFVIKKQENVV